MTGARSGAEVGAEVGAGLLADPRPDPLDEPLDVLFTGPGAAGLRGSLGLHTVGDLLRHYPRRHLVPGELSDFGALSPDEPVVVIAEVLRADQRRMRNRRGSLLNVVVTDGRTQIALTFFQRVPFHAQHLVPGRRLLLTGKLSSYRGTLQLAHPEYELIEEDTRPPGWAGAGQDRRTTEDVARRRVGAPIAVYRSAGKVTSDRIRRSVGMVLDVLREIPDPLPEEVRRERRLLGLHEAFEHLHRPATMDDVALAEDRFRFEEAFVLQAALARRKADNARLVAVPRPARAEGLRAAFEARLPFTLTAGQQAVGAEIAADLARPHPMHRLLQGEVGSGKTVVALRAMLAVVDAGGQAALLAPTEVLATQHHRSITAMLGDLALGGQLGGAEEATRVALLTGSLPATARRRAMLEVASGEAGIVVGTHALLQERVRFADLGLVVVDEQHRFGVEQRDALRAKGVSVPHVLVMTATPIPRTVAMTVFGDLEVSTLDELPAGRSPIMTHVVPAGQRPEWVARAWQRVREEVDAGHQAYVVCPRIGGDEQPTGPDDAGPDDAGPDDAGPDDAGPDDAGPDDAGPDDAGRPPRAVLDVVEELRSEPALEGVVVEMLHGRMPTDEREAVMRRFAAGDVQVLVATTVIEVGVDVPNATAMVVLDADRFGVSQLHQLRGRVGRGSAAGICLLVTDLPGGPARERLDAVAATLDGFELARIDLEQRREGDVLGAAQSGGRSSLRLLRVLRDGEVIESARRAAVRVVTEDPDLRHHSALRAAIDTWLDPDREAYLGRG